MAVYGALYDFFGDSTRLIFEMPFLGRNDIVNRTRVIGKTNNENIIEYRMFASREYTNSQYSPIYSLFILATTLVSPLSHSFQLGLILAPSQLN